MAYTKVFSGLALVAMSLSLAACGGTPGEGGEGAASSEPAPPVIEERQANFKAIGKAFKAIIPVELVSVFWLRKSKLFKRGSLSPV